MHQILAKRHRIFSVFADRQDMLHVGQKIRRARAMKGWSQEQLGEKIHKTRALVSYIEKSGKVNHETLRHILNALGIKEEILENIVDDPSVVYNTNSGELRVEIQNLKEEVEKLKKENQLLKDLTENQGRVISLMDKHGVVKKK
jgi:transcriptional regulator with XRE-family HTH domain